MRHKTSQNGKEKTYLGDALGHCEGGVAELCMSGEYDDGFNPSLLVF